MRAASQKLLQGSKGASKGSAALGYSKYKGGLASKDFDLSRTQGGQTAMEDDTHLFELTENTNGFFLSNMNSAEKKLAHSKMYATGGGATPQPKKGNSIKEESEQDEISFSTAARKLKDEFGEAEYLQMLKDGYFEHLSDAVHLFTDEFTVTRLGYWIMLTP